MRFDEDLRNFLSSLFNCGFEVPIYEDLRNFLPLLSNGHQEAVWEKFRKTF